jgi:hypothetical protein
LGSRTKLANVLNTQTPETDKSQHLKLTDSAYLLVRIYKEISLVMEWREKDIHGEPFLPFFISTTDSSTGFQKTSKHSLPVIN